MRRWLALALLAACHHGVDGDTATSWLEARGQTAPTWEPCLRIGTAMHAACSDDAQCGRTATETFTHWCYAGRYGGAHASDDPLVLSPCFWDANNRRGNRFIQAGEPGYVTQEEWSVRICDRFHLPATPCRAELRDVMRSCTEDLTGAGP
jgi:hypothetical protein